MFLEKIDGKNSKIIYQADVSVNQSQTTFLMLSKIMRNLKSGFFDKTKSLHYYVNSVFFVRFFTASNQYFLSGVRPFKIINLIQIVLKPRALYITDCIWSKAISSSF